MVNDNNGDDDSLSENYNKKYWWWISDSDSNPSSARGSSGWARELWRKKREVEKKETWQLPERRPSNLTNPRLTLDLCFIFPDFVINQLNIRPVEVDYKIEHYVSTSNFWIPVSILLGFWCVDLYRRRWKERWLGRRMIWPGQSGIDARVKLVSPRSVACTATHTHTHTQTWYHFSNRQTPIQE